MKISHILILIFSILLLSFAFILLVDYNKDMYLKEELQYECDLWAGEGLHTVNSITKAVTIEVNNKTFHLKNNETTLKSSCIYK